MSTRFPILNTSIRLSVPYNHDEGYVEGIIEPYAELLAEIYLPVHVTAAYSARPWLGPRQPKVYDDRVRALYDAATPRGVRLSFVANSLIPAPGGDGRLADEVLRLDEAFPGSGFTLANLELAAGIFKERPTVSIQPSTLARVNDATTAWYWKTLVGSKAVTVERAVNKRLDVLRAIRKLGLSIRMVANDDCLPGCPSDLLHQSDISLFEGLARSRPVHEHAGLAVSCRPFIAAVKARYPWLIAQKDILPVHIPRLEGLVDHLKVTCRCAPVDQIAATIERYATMEDNRHNFGGFTEPPEAWDKITSCDRVCDACGWCQRNLEGL